MQAVSVLSLSPSFGSYDSKNEFEYAQASANFASKLKVGDGEFELIEDPKRTVSGEQEKPEKQLESEAQNLDDVDDPEDEDENEDEDFSFVCTNPDNSPTSADDLFQNGQIRPVFPIFNRDLLFADADDGGASPRKEASSSLRSPLKKLFFQERDTASSSASESDELESVPEGTYCEWSRKDSAAKAARELRNKSNSTGSSKLWRVRDLVLRSNSDGKDAFVFLNPNSNSASPKPNQTSVAVKSVNNKITEKVKGSQKAKKAETVSSAHEKHYVRNRAKNEVDKRRSYLPYRPVVGFFTNVNVLSKNVHPF